MPRGEKTCLPDLTQDLEKGLSMSELRDKYSLGSRALLKYITGARRQGVTSDTALGRLPIDTIRYDFPEHPEARLAAVLSCMNSELKQATLLVLDRYPGTSTDISKRLATMANARLPTPGTFSSYCTDTFVPMGFVVQERFRKRRPGFPKNYFAISGPGEKYGQPIAAFSLRYAVDHNLSLYELLGQTASSGDSRSPYNRARLVELVSEGHSTIKDVRERLGLAIEDVRQHLHKLRKLHILTFDSLSFEKKGVNFYTWVRGRLPGEAKTVCQLKKLTGDIARWLHRNKKGERNQIGDALNYPHLCHISRVLVGLAEQGLVHSPFKSTDKSRIILSQKSTLLSDYTRALRNALEEKPDLKDMRAMLEELMYDKHICSRYVDAGVELYNSVSPNINSRTGVGRESELVEFIARFRRREGSGARPVDMVGALGWTHGSVTRHVRMLLRKRLILRVKKGTAARYSLRRT
jgi:DNA-binding MarR family transcriptional regulator